MLVLTASWLPQTIAMGRAQFTVHNGMTLKVAKPTNILMSTNSKLSSRSLYVIEEIEPRILYSADLGPLNVHASPVPVVEQRIIDTTGEFVGLASPDASQAPVEQTRHEIAFVDAGTPEAQAL